MFVLIQFICDPEDVHAVAGSLKSRKVAVKSTAIRRVANPDMLAQLDEEEAEKAFKLISTLEEDPDVLVVYHNVDVKEGEEE